MFRIAHARSLVFRAERGLWFLFLGTIAFQVRFVIWQADALFIEWRSAFIYFSDVLFAGLILFAAVRVFSGKPGTVRWKPSSWDLALAVFVAVAALTIPGSEHRGVSIHGFLRLVQGVLLYGYVRWYAAERFDRDLSLAAFVVGTFAQAVLGLAQFLLQHHVGLHAIGETVLHPRMRGVAVFYDLTATKILRAYGTFPHPNVLAMHLILGLSALWYLYLRHSTATVRGAAFAWFGMLGILSWGFLATFSRTVIAGATLALAAPLAMLLRGTGSRWPNAAVLRRRSRHVCVVLLVSGVAFGALFWPQVLARAGISPHEEAVQLRSFYNAVAIGSGDGWFGVNWFGSGIGNFVTWLMRTRPHLPPWQYQPAHNLYLLVYTEMGVLGITALISFLVLLMAGLVRRRADEPLIKWGLMSLAALLLFTALFDHFFWTIQQGRLLFWLFWGMIAVYATGKQKS